MGCQLGQVAGLPPAFASWCTPAPGAHADHMHRGGIEARLEVRARSATGSTPAAINAPDPLRQAPLHPCPQRLRGCERRCRLALPRRLERLMVDWWADRELAGGCLGGRALPAGGTRATGRPVKPEAHDRGA
jgi:hypothetical protein